MAADFTPDLTPYANAGQFRYWCQTTIPLVYDDSKSYLELLYSVISYLNSTIEDVAAMGGNIDALLEAYTQLQTYVNDYFDNLDVQEEINQKLDDMAASGDLDNLLEPFVQTFVSDWLQEHITPTSPAIDNTLTIEGAAADSKAVGDILFPLRDNAVKYVAVTDTSVYDNLISHIVEPGTYVADQGFTDRPNNSNAYGIMVIRYTANYNIQAAFEYTGLKPRVYYRVVNRNNYNVYMDWTPASNPWNTPFLTAASDLNSLTEDGLYFWTSAANTPANSPFTGNAFMYQYTAPGRNERIQIAYHTQNVDTVLFAIRSRSSANVWDQWVFPAVSATVGSADTVLLFKRGLTASDTLNALTECGIYTYGDSEVPADAPFSYGCLVLVIGSRSANTQKMQICIGYGADANQGIAYRTRAGGIWHVWRYLPYATGDLNISEVLAALIGYKRIITSTELLSDITDNGVYYYTDAGKPADAPYNYGSVMLVYGSLSTTSQKIQLAIGYGADANQGFAYRSLAGGSWHIWKYVQASDTPTGYKDHGKNLSILGDSMSAYAGTVPTGEGYAAYYTGSNCGVSSVNQMWWKRLLDKTGMSLCVNNSVSGSCMSTAARQDRVSGCLPARTGGLHNGVTQPDVIIVFIGINDWFNDVPMGTYDGSGSFPATTETLREAYVIALRAIQTNYPGARILVCTSQHNESGTASPTPVLSQNGITQTAYNRIIREIAEIMCCEVIDLEHCGINTGNVENYTGDGVKLHLNAAGQEKVYLEVLRHFEKG